MVGEPSAGVNDPYFFLSYHRSEYQPGDSADPDRWVKKFYQDLCNDLNQLTSARVPGYMDVHTRLGRDWADELVEALCGCKVFVPLLTRGYFESEWCGREWAAFTQRMQMHALGAAAPAAILPALWIPFPRLDPPPAVGRIQLIPPEFPSVYRDEGFYGLMKLKRYNQVYRESVWLMARAIQQTAQETCLARCPAMAMATVPNAFAEYQAGQQVRVTIASYKADSAGTGKHRPPAPTRSTYYYGRKMREWMPYRTDEDTTLIAHCAERVINGLGHSALLDPLDARESTERLAPSVLLVDPWAARVPGIANDLRAIDRDPMHAVVPWNEDDDETQRAAESLEAGLRGTLPQSLGLQGSAQRVPTLSAFRAALPKAVNEAIAKHFRTAPVFPPVQSGPAERPTLQGPEV